MATVLIPILTPPAETAPVVTSRPVLAPPATGQWISISRDQLGPEVDETN